MKKLLIASMFVMLFAASNLFAQKVPTKIEAIRAQLYFETDGTFSEDMLSAEGVGLWNTIIGEGWAGKPSNSTFVSVEVSGKDLPLSKVKLEITATVNRNRTIGKRLVDVDIYDENTKFFAGLWLNDTGCQEVRLTARLIGVAKAAVIKKTIPFKCGE